MCFYENCKKIFTLNNIVNFIFFGIGFFFCLYVIFKMNELSQSNVVTLLTYSLMMFIFSFRERLVGFSIWGLKAELRSKINEADDIIKKLRVLGKLLIQPSAFTIARLGRFSSGFSHKEMFEFMNKATSFMNSMGISGKEIDETFIVIHQFILFDLMQNAKNVMKVRLEQKLQEKRKNRNDEFKGPIESSQKNKFDRLLCEEKELSESIENLKKMTGIELLFDSYSTLIKEINNNPFFSSEEKKLILEHENLDNLRYYCVNRNLKSL